MHLLSNAEFCLGLQIKAIPALLPVVLPLPLTSFWLIVCHSLNAFLTGLSLCGFLCHLFLTSGTLSFAVISHLHCPPPKPASGIFFSESTFLYLNIQFCTQNLLTFDHFHIHLVKQPKFITNFQKLRFLCFF